MSSWTIYNIQGTPKYTVKDVEYHDTWMGEEYVMVKITSPTPLDLSIGDYLVYRGLTYSVYSVPGALKQASRNTYGEAFVYENIKLSARGTELTDIRFLDYVLNDNNIHYTSLPTFAFYAETVDDLLDRLQANTDREGVQWYFISPSWSRTMQRYEQGTPAYTEAAQLWEKYIGGSHDDPVYDKTEVNISIDKQSVWDGLAPIKNEFGLNFFSKERAIIVGGEGLSAEHVFRYGKGNGLYQIERVADQDQKITTKLYAYGSDKNLPIRYYANITRICFAYLYARPSVDSNILYLDFVWNRSYVTGAADSDGNFPVVVSISGVTYNVKAYPMEVGARTLFTIEASVSLGFVTRSMEIVFVSGIDKDKFPASNVRQEVGGLPNNMAVQVLMLPGFPLYSLADLCRATYDGTQTIFEVRKTPSSAYQEFMRIEGNHVVTFSDDALQPYILSGNVETLGIKEGDVHFVEDNDDNGLKEIYPSIEGMTRGDVEGTSSTERLDEIVSCDVIQDNGVFGEGVTIQNFNLMLKDIGFNLKEAFDNAGQNMIISMKDGYCGGRDFTVHNVTANANGTWTLNVERSHDEGLDLWFPYSTNAAIGQTPTADEPYQIRTGDHFVLTEIEIGDTSYIWAAAMKMLRKSITYLLNNDYTRFTYLPKVDEIYMARQHDESQTQAGIESLHDTLKSGMLMLFEDEDLDVDGSVFIDSLTIKENGNNGIPTYDVVLRNDKQVGTMQRIQNQINSLTSYIGGGGGWLSVSQIRSLINTYGGELFLSKVNADIAAGRITFQQGMEALMLSVFNGIRNNGRVTSDEADIPRFVSDTTFDGILHVMAKIVANQIESDNFNGDGPFDTGFELTKSDSSGYSFLVVDKLYVRLKAIFNELEIRKISYSGGNFIFSHAGSHIVYVKELQLGVESEVEGTVLKLSGAVDVADNVLNVGSGSVSGSTINLSSDKRVYAYRCYIMKDDGTTATENWWRVDDQARCQTFNVVEPGHYENVENTSYWRRVIAVGHEKVRLNDSEQEQEYDYVDLSLIDCMQGSDIPKAGDQIVQIGNRTDAERQGFISLEVAGEYAPAFKVYKGVNGYTLDGKRKICISPKLTDIRAQKFTIETEYDTSLMPMERGDWRKIPEHKCYYYNLVQHNGATWLCVCPEGEYTTEEPSETATYWRPYAQKGKDGKDGKSFNILGSYDTVEELIAAHPTGSVGDAYMVAGDLYVWDEVNTRWHNSGRIQGDAGRGIASAEIVYGVSENPATLPTEWEASPAELTIGPGDYLFVRTILRYDDGTDAAPYYSISRFGVDGSFKQTAFTRTNKNISSQQLSGNPLPNDFVFDGETIHFSDGIPTGEKRVWATSNIFYGDGTQSGWTSPTPMTDTSTFDVEFSPNETKPANPSDNESQREAQGWYDTTRNPSHDFSTTIWRAERQKKNGEWGAWAIEKVKGEKGDSVAYDEEHSSVGYAYSSMGTPESGRDYPSDITSWSQTPPAVQKGKYLWAKDVTAYDNAGTIVYTTTYGVQYQPNDGESVEIDSSRTFIKYCRQTKSQYTGQHPADSEFSVTYPTNLGQGDYLWILNQVAYVGVANPMKSYSVSMLGTDGGKGDTGADGYTTHFAYATSADGSQNFSTMNFQGATYIGTYRDQLPDDSTDYHHYVWTKWKGENGDSVTVDEQNSKTEYVVSNQGTSAPTSGWSTTIPSVPQGQYLWTKVTTAFTDGNSTVSYGVSYRGTDGDDVQIDTSRTYARYSTVKTASQPADSTFTLTTPPQLSEGDYLWSLSQTAYVGVSSVLKSYSVSRLGIDGNEGKKGADGYTTHFAYATSADGSQGFSTTNFNGATYIGTYKDQKAPDSTNYRDYTWTKWKGENGRGITNVNIYYKADTTTPVTPSGSPSGTGWTDDGNSLIIPANANKHLYESTCTEYSDGTYSWTTPIDDGLISDMASTAEEFALSDSNTTAPTSGWASSVNPIAGKWIWSRTVLTFKSGNPTYTNTQCVGYCGTNGKDGTDSVTTSLSTQTVEIPTDTDGVCLEDTQIELSARVFVGSKEVKVTDIVVDEQSSQRVTSVVKSTLDMMPWATSADASVQGNVITFSRNASVQGAVLTIGGDAFNVTPSKVVVTIAKGTVVNEHTVILRVTGVDEDKTTHYGFAAFNVQRHYIPVDGQDAINIIVTPAALIVNQSLQNPDNLSQLSEEIIFSATMGERQVAVNKVEVTSTERCTVEGSNGNKATVRAIGTYTEEGSNYYYDKANFICKVYTAYGVIENIKADIYANLLGTWKETVEADTKTEVARSLTYGYDPESGEIIPIENFGYFIKSSEENISTLSQKIGDENSGLIYQVSTIDQKADRISLSVESKESTNLVPDPDIYQMLTTFINRDVALKKDREYTLTARLKNTATSSRTCGIDILTADSEVVETLGCVLNAGVTKNFSKTFTSPADGDFTIRVPQTASVQLQWLQVEQGDAFTQHTSISSAFQRTGIDIENGLIKATTNNFKICNSSGTETFSVDANGNIVAAGNAKFNGNIETAGGTIGGFVIDSDNIHSTAVDSSSNPLIRLNNDGSARIGGLIVANNGDATLTGTINATGGNISGNLTVGEVAAHRYHFEFKPKEAAGGTGSYSYYSAQLIGYSDNSATSKEEIFSIKMGEFVEVDYQTLGWEPTIRLLTSYINPYRFYFERTIKNKTYSIRNELHEKNSSLKTSAWRDGSLVTMEIGVVNGKCNIVSYDNGSNIGWITDSLQTPVGGVYVTEMLGRMVMCVRT